MTEPSVRLTALAHGGGCGCKLSPAVLRERVTSKGGTTHAAISRMQADQLDGLFQAALEAARLRAQALGDEFGK